VWRRVLRCVPALGTAAVLVLLAAPTSALDPCLTGPSAPAGATGEGDSAEVLAARAAAEAACGCAAFDESSCGPSG
jgi:hypothetical protein